MRSKPHFVLLKGPRGSTKPQDLGAPGFRVRAVRLRASPQGHQASFCSTWSRTQGFVLNGFFQSTALRLCQTEKGNVTDYSGTNDLPAKAKSCTFH